MESILLDTRAKMQQALSLLLTDFSTIRTGKANAALIENAMIRAYAGSPALKLLELATIHVQDHTTLIATPFDQSIIGEIQKGILEANVGLNPVAESTIIRITIPPLTEERRQELVKLVNQKTEAGRVMMRQIRHEAMEKIKKRAKEQSVSEDEVMRLEKETQKITDEFIEKIDTLRDQKETELLSV